MISGQSRNCAIGCLINYGLILELGIYALQLLGAVISYFFYFNQSMKTENVHFLNFDTPILMKRTYVCSNFTIFSKK